MLLSSGYNIIYVYLLMFSRFRKTLERKQQLFQPIVPLMDIMKQKIGSPFSLSAQQFRVKDGRAVIPPGIEKRGKATDQKATQEAAIKQKQLIARKPAGRLMKPETALEGRGKVDALFFYTILDRSGEEFHQSFQR